MDLNVIQPSSFLWLMPDPEKFAFPFPTIEVLQNRHGISTGKGFDPVRLYRFRGCRKQVLESVFEFVKPKPKTQPVNFHGEASPSVQS